MDTSTIYYFLYFTAFYNQSFCFSLLNFQTIFEKLRSDWNKFLSVFISISYSCLPRYFITDFNVYQFLPVWYIIFIQFFLLLSHLNLNALSPLLRFFSITFIQILYSFVIVLIILLSFFSLFMLVQKRNRNPLVLDLAYPRFTEFYNYLIFTSTI